jgi:hypothetical protein
MLPFSGSVIVLFFTAAKIVEGTTAPVAIAADPVKTCLIRLRLLTLVDMASEC